MELLHLLSDEIDVSIDPGRGADILGLAHRETGVDVLFRTPWRDRADAVRAGQRPISLDSQASWLEGYRGGWQVLCPVAGAARSVHGAPVGFHGEASLVPWDVVDATSSAATLRTLLFSVPLGIERQLRLDGNELEVTDRIWNQSRCDISFDYSHHIAFGGPFLDSGGLIQSGAATFTSDGASKTWLPGGTRFEWPTVTTAAGESVDLSVVPDRRVSRETFGWLGDFASAWARIASRDLKLSVDLEWDHQVLPYAWFWQELNSTAEFPWFRRARATAIEPASTVTSGDARHRTMSLGALSEVAVSLQVRLTSGAGE